MKTAAVILLLVLFNLSLPAQCPDRSFLWHRIIFLRDSSTVPSGKQLEELLGYHKKINQCKYRNDSTHALLLQRIGILYAKQKDYYSGIQYTGKSISLVNQFKGNPSVNPAMSIKSYRNLYMMYDSLKMESKKTAAIDSCISHALRFGTGYNFALDATRLNIERLFGIGDYFRCIQYAKLGETFINKLNTSPLEKEQANLESFSWKINALIFSKQTNEARRLLYDRIRFAETHRKPDLLATYYGLYATVLKEEGKAREAIGYYKKSFTYNQQIGYQAGCAQALNNIGFTFSTRLHENKMAMPYYFRALQFADANESLNILDNIANIYVQSGNYDSAFFFFRKAFDQLGPGFTEADLLKNNQSALPGKITEYITGMVLDKAGAWFNKYKVSGNKEALKEAIRIYELTDRYFDKIKESQSEIQSKLFWKTNNRRLYENSIEACYTIQNKDKAFYFFEKSRSVLLNDQIMEQRWMNDRDLAKQAQLKKNILEIERHLQNNPASSKDNLTLQQQLITSKQEQEILRKNINDLHPSHAQNYFDSSSLNLEIIRRNILKGEKSLLEIFTGDSAVYILAITSGNTSLIKRNRYLYDSLSTAYISFIGRPERLNKDFAGFVNISQNLYKLIFQNLQLKPGGSLIISPDGKGFPFESLILNADYRQPDYLLNHYATSYTYSAGYLMNEYAVNRGNRNSVFGMAPVIYKSSFGLAELPGSDISLQRIKNEFSDATIFVKEKATKNNFLHYFPEYAVVQLYTHAADTSANNDPVIYFADSALYLSDLIPDRKPVTQLVILSACETANGKLYQGEGIFSFNRGFAALGIPAAVSNLWSVDNQSTYRITELFYKYLAQGLPTDIALQKAKLEFITTSSSKEKKLPYFWAGSILTGKVDSIKNNTSFLWKGLALAGLFILCLGYFANKNILKKKKETNPDLFSKFA
ncbi:MAG: CHAT domain-containing protein [Ferruginibacter sp.]|nr:CHAT domain-containing protein [Ferruginibacter sp.]